MFVDTVVLGDTPFSIAVQEALRTMGFSSVLVYTGDPNIRYIHYEDIGTPSILCRYTLKGVDASSRLRKGQYISMFHQRIGGNVWFFSSLSEKVGSDYLDIHLIHIPQRGVQKRGGIIGEPSKISLVNKFVRVNGERLDYKYLVVTESLRVFLERLGATPPVLESRSLGVLLEESYYLLDPIITYGPLDGGPEDPLVSYTRGFLTHHIFPEGARRVNVTVQDAVKIPGNASLDLSVSLESKGVILVGPRGLWNSGLSMSSELLRLRGILSGDFTLSSDCAVPSQV